MLVFFVYSHTHTPNKNLQPRTSTTNLITHLSVLSSMFKSLSKGLLVNRKIVAKVLNSTLESPNKDII
jgi:hypothetical protein